jgi:hypothetical protein
MGQISVEISGPNGSVLSGNQQCRRLPNALDGSNWSLVCLHWNRAERDIGKFSHDRGDDAGREQRFVPNVNAVQRRSHQANAGGARRAHGYVHVPAVRA